MLNARQRHIPIHKQSANRNPDQIRLVQSNFHGTIVQRLPLIVANPNYNFGHALPPIRAAPGMAYPTRLPHILGPRSAVYSAY
jgi:hypothetical protein